MEYNGAGSSGGQLRKSQTDGGETMGYLGRQQLRLVLWIQGWLQLGFRGHATESTCERLKAFSQHNI